jgi:hypothetical protein
MRLKMFAAKTAGREEISRVHFPAEGKEKNPVQI